MTNKRIDIVIPETIPDSFLCDIIVTAKAHLEDALYFIAMNRDRTLIETQIELCISKLMHLKATELED